MLNQTEFISNTTEKTIINHLAELFEQSSRVYCAMAYFSIGGWALIRPVINNWFRTENRKMRILVGQDATFPGPQAIKELNQYPGVEISLIPVDQFHAKQWLFYGKDGVQVLTGSANLTKKGLFHNAEASVINTLPYKHPELLKLQKNYESWWLGGNILPKEGAQENIANTQIESGIEILESEHIKLTVPGFDEVTATIKVNNRQYFAFLRQMRGTGTKLMKESLNNLLSEIWKTENVVTNYREKIGENWHKNKLGSFESPSIVTTQTFGKLSASGNQFRVYATGTHDRIGSFLPKIFNAGNIVNDWNPRFISKVASERGSKRKFFASPAIQITYLNKIPHTYFGLSFNDEIERLSIEDIYKFALAFHKYAIEFPEKIFIDSVFRITNGNVNFDGVIAKADPVMREVGFTQELESRHWDSYARIPTPDSMLGTDLLDVCQKHFTGVLNRHHMWAK